MHDKIFDDSVQLIAPDETLEDLQLGGLRILQKREGFRFCTDAVILTDFARIAPSDVVVDFGTGTGILPLLLLGRGKGARFEALELQSDLADMARRTMIINGLSDRVTVRALPVERAEEAITPGTMDAVICNPPYALPGTASASINPARALARQQTDNGLAAWFRTAYRLLRGRGRLSMVYPAAQLLSAMTALQSAGLEPKRYRLVYPTLHKPASLALIEAVKSAKPTLHPEPPLILLDDGGQMTGELQRIYHLT